MKNRIIMYSGGKGSFAVADYVKTHYPNDNILLYFTDTKWEHPDLYRFLYEGADKLELPLLIHADGRNPMQLMFDDKVVFNSRIGQCSIKLKAGVSSDYIRKGKVPNEEKWYNKEFLKSGDFRNEPILYFGIDWTEEHRRHAIERNWSPYQVELPLIDNVIDEDEVLAKHKIKQPRLYELGFSHNNCFGRCVKAGQGHFKNLHAKLPDVFRDTKERERAMSDYASAHHYLKNEHYIPPHLQMSEEERELALQELEDLYRPYLYDEVGEPPRVSHPADDDKPIVVDKLLVDRWFVYGVEEGSNDNKKVLRTVKTPVRRANKYLKSCYRLVETRHMIKKEYSFMKKMKDGKVHPYHLDKLEEDIKSEPEQIDMFDVGGCGCFIDM